MSGRLSVVCSAVAIAAGLIVSPAHATRPCTYEEFRSDAIRGLLKGLFVKMEANGVPYTKSEANLRLRHLGEVRDARLGGRVFVEELSFRADNDSWYALHNVPVRSGNSSIDATAFKIAFAEPYTKAYSKLDGTRELTCIVGLAEGPAIGTYAFQIFNASKGGQHVADVMPKEIDDYLPAAYFLKKLP